MLVICMSCRKVIGCGITPEGKITYMCIDCKVPNCIFLMTPGQAIVKQVTLVIFPNGCRGHYDFHIGFQQSKSPP